MPSPTAEERADLISKRLSAFDGFQGSRGRFESYLAGQIKAAELEAARVMRDRCAAKVRLRAHLCSKEIVAVLIEAIPLEEHNG